MIGLLDYLKIKDNYCLCYFGTTEEYLLELRMLRPIMERHFNGLKIFLSCKDICFHYFDGMDRTLRMSELKEHKSKFAHVKELRASSSEHPIYEFLVHSGVNNYRLPTGPIDFGEECVVISKGVYPTKSMTTLQIELAKKTARNEGRSVVLDGNPKNAGLVIGVESVGLVEAAAKGIPVRLVPNGTGTRLLKNMFSNVSILEI